MFTGFRLAMGGAQDYYGVVPDIAAFGKAMANGFPIAAVVSRKDILEGCPELIISSTYGGEILSLVAGIETVRELREKEVPRHIGEYGRRLKEGLLGIVRSVGVPVRVVGAPHLPYVDFQVERDIYEDIWTLYLQEMAKRGVLVRRQMYMYIAYTHSEEDLERTLEAFEGGLLVIKRALESGDVKGFLETIEPSRPGFLSLSR